MSLDDFIADIEKKIILQTLEITNYNKSEAASLLGIKTSVLQYKMSKYHIGIIDSSSERKE
jgi:DNA-binding NtrC family response regulator